MNPRTTVNGLAVALVATGLALLSACGSDRTPISELPTLTAPEPTSTPRPVATRPPTATPTPVPPTPTSEATATPVPATPTPTREVAPELPVLIVEGQFEWPGSAVALTAEEQDALNLGVSFFNLAYLLIGPNPDAASGEYETLRQVLSPGAIDFMDFQRDDASRTTITPGKESDNLIRSFQIRTLESGDQQVAVCFNFHSTNDQRGEAPTTTVLTYAASLENDRWTMGSFNLNGVDTVLRDCTDDEMLS